MPVALVAIGGNSLITDNKRPDVIYQWEAVRETCRHLATMVEAGWQLIITHGNGPQVGFILRRSEVSAHVVHTTPLDIVVSDTQGSIGYMLQQSLGNELGQRGQRRPIVSVVTQVLVDAADPAFENPTKPIGGFMEASEARQFESQGWQTMEDAGRGWRRVVASPRPLQIIEESAIRDLLAAGNIVIAVGGGGIPVAAKGPGKWQELRGTYAVVDKDLASGLLAKTLGIDLFVISTGVEQIALNYNTPQQRNLGQVTTGQLSRYLTEGHFAAGSMKPKVEAVLDFVIYSGQKALITNPPNIARALAWETGTWIVRG